MFCLYQPVTHSTIIFFHDKAGYLIKNKPSCTLWYVLKQVSGPEVVPISLGILQMPG